MKNAWYNQNVNYDVTAFDYLKNGYTLDIQDHSRFMIKYILGNFDQHNFKNNLKENKMKFKIGDTILLRGVIREIQNKYTFFVRFDNGTGNTYLNEQEIEAGVLYPSDIPLPNQEVWVRDEDDEEWKKGIYLHYDNSDANYPHCVYNNKGYTDIYKQVTILNPNIKDYIEFQKRKYSIQELKNIIKEYEKEKDNVK